MAKLSNRDRVINTLRLRGYTDAEALAYCNEAFGEDNPVPPAFHMIKEVLTSRTQAVVANMPELVDMYDKQLIKLRGSHV